MDENSLQKSDFDYDIHEEYIELLGNFHIDAN